MLEMLKQQLHRMRRLLLISQSIIEPSSLCAITIDYWKHHPSFVDYDVIFPFPPSSFQFVATSDFSTCNSNVQEVINIEQYQKLIKHD